MKTVNEEFEVDLETKVELNVSYICREPYYLVPENARTTYNCINGGSWTNKEFSCLHGKIDILWLYKLIPYILFVAECTEIVPTGGLLINSSSETHYGGKLFSGATVEFSCVENYILSDSTNLVAECLQNGEWSISTPFCVKGRLKRY